jgi:hypothetical protein
MTALPHFSSADQTTPAQVAAAVLAVLREMNPAASAKPASVVNHQTKAPAVLANHTINSDSSIHYFPGSLLLERHALEVPRGIHELAISPRAVITPLAREILRKNGVSVRLASAFSAGSLAATQPGQWAIVRLSASAQGMAAESLLAGRTGEGWEIVGHTVDEGLSWLGQGPNRYLGVLAEVACVAVWRLAKAGIRAAEVRSGHDVERVVKHFAPQSFVVEPGKMPIHEVKQIFQAWRRMGVATVPPELMADQAAKEADR